MNRYCDINSEAEEGFADLTFDIINYKKKMFGGYHIECVAADREDVVGFALEIKKMTGLEGNDINSWHTYVDGIKIEFLDGLSDNLIKSIMKSYGFEALDLKLKSESFIECGSLSENPLDFENSEIKFKCFVDAANAYDLYAEFYINVDLPNKKVHINEKDPAYRENIVKYLSI